MGGWFPHATGADPRAGRQARLLREARRRAGKSQAAAAVGLHVDNYARRESGAVTLTPREIAARKELCGAPLAAVALTVRFRPDSPRSCTRRGCAPASRSKKRRRRWG